MGTDGDGSWSTTLCVVYGYSAVRYADETSGDLKFVVYYWEVARGQ